MARRRLQQKGDLYEQGGYWKLRWKEDQRLADGSVGYGWSKPVWIGPCEGRGRLTRKQAARIAWENFLSRLDQNIRTPQSIMTVREFVERKYLPEHAMIRLKPAGRYHVQQMLKFVLDGVPERRADRHKVEVPETDIARHCGIGGMRLRDVKTEDAQRLVSEAIARGYSTKTAREIRTCVSGVFTYAERMDWFNGKNPARFVALPQMTRVPPPVALSFDPLKALLSMLKPQARAMVLCASLTSMNIAEVCGLRWKRLNLGPDPVIVDGESIPGYHAAVREQWYMRQWGSVKGRSGRASARRRNLPLPTLLVEALGAVRASAKFIGTDDPVFAGEAGRPIDQQAMLKRQVRKVAAGMGFPKLGWHDLRRTFATLADQSGMSMGDRKELMGHSTFAMTLRYTHTPTEQAQRAIEELGERVRGKVN
jgi:integrase